MLSVSIETCRKYYKFMFNGESRLKKNPSLHLKYRPNRNSDRVEYNTTNNLDLYRINIVLDNF